VEKRLGCRGVRPGVRIGPVADRGEGGDPQPRRAHGNEGDGLGGLVGLHGAVLKRGDEAEAVELPFRNPPGLRLQCDGHSVEGERHVRLRPCPLGDLERGGRAIRVEHQPVPLENAERGMRNGEWGRRNGR